MFNITNKNCFSWLWCSFLISWLIQKHMQQNDSSYFLISRYSENYLCSATVCSFLFNCHFIYFTCNCFSFFFDLVIREVEVKVILLLDFSWEVQFLEHLAMFSPRRWLYISPWFSPSVWPKNNVFLIPVYSCYFISRLNRS